MPAKNMDKEMSAKILLIAGALCFLLVAFGVASFSGVGLLPMGLAFCAISKLL
jgi:hypothetical protein